MDIGLGIGRSLAWSGALYIAITVLCIVLAWKVLQQFRFDLFVKQPGSPQARMLQIVASIALGYQLARFVIDYLNWSTLLKGMFS
jgi:uncharacterized integral membrane protein (TIGR02327 family)